MKKLGTVNERDIGPLRRFWRDEDATTSLEYALMLAFVALSAVAGYQALGGSVADGVGARNQDMSAFTSPVDGAPGPGHGMGNAYGHGNGHANGNGYGHGGFAPRGLGERQGR